jgi:hypothetical protein
MRPVCPPLLRQTRFQHALPLDRCSMTRWRRSIKGHAFIDFLHTGHHRIGLTWDKCVPKKVGAAQSVAPKAASFGLGPAQTFLPLEA